MTDHRGDVSSKKQHTNLDSYVERSPGPYIGIVKSNDDPLRMGRLGVNIPAKTGTNDPIFSQLMWCSYLSPFYGAKSTQAVSSTNAYDYKTNSHSYGMWAVPPDIDTSVMVIFAQGIQTEENAYWIGCVQQPQTNHQVPGLAASERAGAEETGSGLILNPKTGVEEKTAGRNIITSKEAKQDYGTNYVPAGEVNRVLFQDATIGPYSNYKSPVNDKTAELLKKQGLIQDSVRGTTSSSAQREAPSAVFGMNTPGRIRSDSRKLPILVTENSRSAYIPTDRDPGHTFAMDDGDAVGDNQLVRLRTASGHQLLMHDTDGVVYIANGSGNAWIEMNKEGRIDVYSGVGGISLRTEGDFNLHSDANINMSAGNEIRMAATGTDEVLYKDTDIAVTKGHKAEGDVKIPASLGQIITSADYQMHMGDKGVFTSSQQGPVMTYGKSGILSYSDNQQLHGAGGPVHLAGSQVHLNSIGASSSWGPTWLSKEQTGMLPREEGDVELSKKGLEPLQSFTRKTKTTVHRLVTHEPMPRFSGFSSQGVVPSQIDDDKMDTKMWSRLSSTPGTVEFVEQRNRTSSIESIRLGQWQADAERYLKKEMGNSTSVKKAKQLLETYGTKYDKTFNVVSQTGDRWDTAKSISNKIQNFSLSDAKNTIKNNFTNTLTNQVIESVSGKATNLFKDNIFVNQTGQLFSIGQSVHGKINELQYVKDNAKSLATSYVTNIVNDKISGVISASSVGSIFKDAGAVTNVYKNVMAGNITGVTQITSLAQKFGIGRSGYIGKSLHGTGTPVQGAFMAKIATNFAKIGNWASEGIGHITKLFSDVRLKEDIQLVGKSQLGTNIYSFKYKHLDGTYQGVIAQEVPWASEIADNGYYMVDYAKLDVEFRRLN